VFTVFQVHHLTKKHGDETRSTVAGAAVLTDSSIQLFADRVRHMHFGISSFFSHRYLLKITVKNLAVKNDV